MESRRNKKKKKVAAKYKIDEDDRDLILDNTGIEVKTKHRLKRNADVD